MPLGEHPSVYWGKGAILTPAQWLAKRQREAEAGKDAAAAKTDAHFEKQNASPPPPLPASQLAAADTFANRLKWMLEQTMGCPNTFELRRAELELAQEKIEERVTDEDVVRSFREMASPDGPLAEYLQAGKLVLIKGDAMFLHGGLSPLAAGWLPGRPAQKEGDARAW